MNRIGLGKHSGLRNSIQNDDVPRGSGWVDRKIIPIPEKYFPVVNGAVMGTHKVATQIFKGKL